MVIVTFKNVILSKAFRQNNHVLRVTTFFGRGPRSGYRKCVKGVHMRRLYGLLYFIHL